MEIMQKGIEVKLDREERETLINAIKLMGRMSSKLSFACGAKCPFKDTCDARSDSTCFFDLVAEDLKDIKNICD